MTERHDSGQGGRPEHPSKHPRKRPTGRRSGDSGTREVILDTAIALFAERGYEGTSVRSIAQQAGVDPALVRHFFTSKESLFVSAVADRSAIPERLAAALHGDPAGAAERVADTYLRLWKDPQTGPILLALARSATTSPRAAGMLREVLGSRARELAGAGISDEQFTGLILAAAQLFGVAVARHIVKFPEIASLDHDTLVRRVAPTIQRHLALPRP